MLQAQVLSALSHKNVIQFYGAVTKEPNYCLVTEYAENGSLYDFLQKPSHTDALTFAHIVQWAQDIAMGNY